MRCVVDIEANGLESPTEIWLIVCKNIDTGEKYIFRHPINKEEFNAFHKRVTYWIGHNLCGYDAPVVRNLLGVDFTNASDGVCDTLIVSRLVNYSREGGHSIEQYGKEFGLEKIPYWDWTKWSQEMEDYCVRDVDICEQIYNRYSGIVADRSWRRALDLEHKFQQVVNSLHDTGFAFNSVRARSILEKVTEELKELDNAILAEFPPRTRLVKEYSPRLTKYGTISRTSVPRNEEDLSAYSEGAVFSRIKWEVFNPSSHKQLIEVLAGAGWQPIDKTKSHIEAERRGSVNVQLARTGWKINETNLGTLPEKAPKPARLLAKRILLESRRRTLTEWLGLVQSDGRIHGRFYGIGAWTHRMAHQQPNTANIPNEYDTSGKVKLLGKEMRQLWIAPKKRLLVGVDAEGIQLRVFAHYINDKEFTDALVRGRKDDKTDPHSLNQRIIGNTCKSRAAAKRFIYALLLGAGLGKLSEILEASREQTEGALHSILERYTGFAHLKQTVIPQDARKGWFLGLDGRKVQIPGDTAGERKHLCMSGYLQNGEAVIMKNATLKWWSKLDDYDAKLVNKVHDEWQAECPNNVQIALQIAKLMANSLEEVGEDFKLNCPLSGSYWNDDHKDYTIGTNWYQTH